MSLRVAFDIDGVLADFRTAFQQAAQFDHAQWLLSGFSILCLARLEA